MNHLSQAFLDGWAAGAWRAPAQVLLAAFIFGQALGWTYDVTHRGVSYSRGFTQGVVLVCISSAILVLALGYSLMAGVGLLGVLSMIRFRVNLKAPRDLVFIMGSATIGVATGVGALVPACVGAAVFCGVSLYLHLSSAGARTRYDGVLRFRVEPHEDRGATIAKILRVHCRRTELMSVTELAQGSRIEHAYQIKFRRRSGRDQLVQALRTDGQVRDARLLMQEAALEY